MPSATPENSTAMNSASNTPASNSPSGNSSPAPDTSATYEAATPCPCGSGALFTACCGPYIQGSRRPPTAEALMRSRYSAYARCDGTYLRETWHTSTRPSRIRFADDQTWLGLEIRATEDGGPLNTEGTVEFIAKFRNKGGSSVIHELSQFVKDDGRWTYVSGIHDPQ